MIYSFNLYNKLASDGIYTSLKKISQNNKTAAVPVILCVGSDLSVGDSLGPLVGTMLKERLCEHNIYIYGTLPKPVTAKEINYINNFLKYAHPEQKVIAVDAAVGDSNDVGLIKIASKALNPGSGANKKLNSVGDISIIGVVAEKSIFNYALFSATRLNMVYRMADIISNAIYDYIEDLLSGSSNTA